MMEDIPVSPNEHKVLHKFKRLLEFRYKVTILMPDLQTPDLCASETIFVKIIGSKRQIKSVQQFIQSKVLQLAMENQEKDESVIVLNSDSDDDHNKADSNVTKKPPKKKRCLEKSIVDPVSPAVKLGNQSPSCEVSSTTNAADESVIILDDAAADFIPICSHVPSFNEIKTSKKNLPAMDNETIVISSDEEDTVSSASKLPVLPMVIPAARRLRPIVIDGSNIARAHGRPRNTFSCKGIEIAVNYFLERGHTEVVAFVPLFRRHCRNGPVFTTDQDVLERLERTQNVYFTPSRRVEGKLQTCYDDRFVVSLAAKNGGVILSNDNYKDLMEESEVFKDTIKNRLLMYVFVQDILMIPEDPQGLRGPGLNEYLSFPP